MTVALASVLYVGCAQDSSPTPGTSAAPAEDFEATAADFRNLHTMTPVRGFFVDNRLGHLRVRERPRLRSAAHRP
jgi:hypothetical protein